MAPCNVRNSFCLLSTMALLLVLSNGASAQELSPGTRIRLSDTRQSAVTGRVLAVGRDSILFSPFMTTEVRSLPLARVVSLERSLGGNSGRGGNLGSLWGSVIGFFGTGLFQAAGGGPDDGLDDTAAWALSGAVSGFFAGKLAGTIFGGERWRPVEMQTGQTPLPPAEMRPRMRAQVQLDSLRPNSTVQFRTFASARFSGRYDGRDQTHARLVGDSTVLVPVIEIKQIAQQQRATGLYARRGLWIGALTGTALMSAAMYANRDDCDEACVSVDPAGIAFSALAGGAAGLMTGIVIGASTNRWQVQRW